MAEEIKSHPYYQVWRERESRGMDKPKSWKKGVCGIGKEFSDRKQPQREGELYRKNRNKEKKSRGGATKKEVGQESDTGYG